MNGENELPEGWVSAILKDITIDVKNVKPENEPNREFEYVDISSINNRTYTIEEIKSFFGKEAPSRARRPIKKDDVLFSNVRTYLRNISIVPEKFDNQLCSTGFTVLRPSSTILPKYLFYYVLTDSFIDNVSPQQRGSQYPATSDGVVRSVSIPLPPLAEQRRIVAAVEALLARVNASRERLDRVPGLLKAFRQAVLAAACSGRLTEGWRGEHPEIEPASILLKNYFEREHPKKHKSKLGDLKDISKATYIFPKCWTSTKLKKIIYFAGRIGWRGLKSEEYTPEGPILLAAYNIKENYIVDFSEVNHISTERYVESPEIQLKNDDIILVKDGSGIGKIGIIKNLPSEATVNSSLLLIRPSKIIVPEFLLFLLSGPAMQRIVKERITGSATPHLFQRDIKEFEILIPPLAEQHEIVRRVEALFALADRIEQRVAAAKERADRLTQAILAKAFRGEMVPTEAELARREGRGYEQASVLLERIRGERSGETMPKTRRGKRKSGVEN